MSLVHFNTQVADFVEVRRQFEGEIKKLRDEIKAIEAREALTVKKLNDQMSDDREKFRLDLIKKVTEKEKEMRARMNSSLDMTTKVSILLNTFRSVLNGACIHYRGAHTALARRNECYRVRGWS